MITILIKLTDLNVKINGDPKIQRFLILSVRNNLDPPPPKPPNVNVTEPVLMGLKYTSGALILNFCSASTPKNLGPLVL